MKAWSVVCLISTGGLTETMARGSAHDAPLWGVILGVSLLGWTWASLLSSIAAIRARLILFATGRPQPVSTADPKATAAELAALNAQVAQLRDTATSFDVSFDHTLQRLDERLRRVEQQTSYVQVRPNS